MLVIEYLLGQFFINMLEYIAWKCISGLTTIAELTNIIKDAFDLNIMLQSLNVSLYMIVEKWHCLLEFGITPS